ncbi:hypothetical protein GALMADRAFT_137548 [Galerina marginata CBS 339.88]|uniref:Uncharacterized protein n=1 Tax=Galerina marginata (strain CBS 339.88) TaxID=685588 RepID=A0A067T5P8_GALM3|nr:hypothetical protein GALMADRAFT_137548 [Galerina marginata CBS 339.88]
MTSGHSVGRARIMLLSTPISTTSSNVASTGLVHGIYENGRRHPTTVLTTTSIAHLTPTFAIISISIPNNRERPVQDAAIVYLSSTTSSATSAAATSIAGRESTRARLNQHLMVSLLVLVGVSRASQFTHLFLVTNTAASSYGTRRRRGKQQCSAGAAGALGLRRERIPVREQSDHDSAPRAAKT